MANQAVFSPFAMQCHRLVVYGIDSKCRDVSATIFGIAVVIPILSVSRTPVYWMQP